MSYIGRGIDSIDNISTLDNLTFNGSDATFNLTQNSVAFVPVSADALQIQIDGVIQSGNYTVSGSTVTFDFTPSGSSVCNGIRHYGVGLLSQPSDGSVNMAQLGASGTKDATTFLRGDNTFATVSGTTINNNADNRVITGSGTANTLEGESNLTYSSPDLTVSGGNPSIIHNNTTSGGDSGIKFQGSGVNYGFVNLDNSDGALDLGTSVGWSTRFYTNNAERMRITSDGDLNFAQGQLQLLADNSAATSTAKWDRGAGQGGNTSTALQFCHGGSVKGSISYDDGSTSYNTSSDYRLKENAVAISDGITRLKTLKPYRFNFKTNTDKTIDGFFAHEVTAVPEAINGEKDATETYTDDNGDEQTRIKPQGIDQSKLVPLLTSALQEAITKIETLETENTDIKARLTALENA